MLYEKSGDRLSGNVAVIAGEKLLDLLGSMYNWIRGEVRKREGLGYEVMDSVEPDTQQFPCGYCKLVGCEIPTVS